MTSSRKNKMTVFDIKVNIQYVRNTSNVIKGIGLLKSYVRITVRINMEQEWGISGCSRHREMTWIFPCMEKGNFEKYRENAQFLCLRFKFIALWVDEDSLLNKFIQQAIFSDNT